MNSDLNRRHFVKLGAFAAAATTFAPGRSAAAQTITLPALAFPFDALEPHIDTKTMEIHHGKHHAAYIEKLNEALTKHYDLAAERLVDTLTTLPSINDETLRNTFRNHGGGHWNHTFFWQTLSPAGMSGKPSDALNAAFIRDFGSFEAFQAAFNEAAAKRFGSGWAWLIVKDGKLKITSTPNQDNPLMKGIVPDADLGAPVLGLDVWEHAYYLKYQNRRPEYVTAWWNVINWTAVNERFQKAS